MIGDGCGEGVSAPRDGVGSKDNGGAGADAERGVLVKKAIAADEGSRTGVDRDGSAAADEPRGNGDKIPSGAAVAGAADQLLEGKSVVVIDVAAQSEGAGKAGFTPVDADGPCEAAGRDNMEDRGREGFAPAVHAPRVDGVPVRAEAVDSPEGKKLRDLYGSLQRKREVVRQLSRELDNVERNARAAGARPDRKQVSAKVGVVLNVINSYNNVKDQAERLRKEMEKDGEVAPDPPEDLEEHPEQLVPASVRRRLPRRD